MADAYGGISLSTSEDCVVNSAEFISVLNGYEWSNANGEWIVNEREEKPTFWYRDDFNCQYPTAFTQKPLAVVLIDENREEKRIPYHEASDEDLDNHWDIEYKRVSLEYLSHQFAKTIVNGWVEIACTANEKNRYVYFESIRIYANGRAESREVISGTCTQPHYEFKTFAPSAI